MMSRIAFACLGKPLLLVYEKSSNSEMVSPIICFEKNTKTVVPFEKGIFENLQAVFDHVCWILTSSQVKEFLDSLEASTLNEMNKFPKYRNQTDELNQ